MSTLEKTMLGWGKIRSAALLISALLLICATASFAAENKDTSEEMEENAAAVVDFTIEQKDKAVAKAEELMDFLDGKMEIWEGKMEENWDELKVSSKKYYKASLKELRKLRNDVSEWYGSMKYSSKETWEETKQGFANAYDKVVSTLHESETQPEKTE